MPYKMIPFPYEIKITHSDFCYYMVFTFLIKIDTVEAFYFFISIIMALRRMV